MPLVYVVTAFVLFVGCVREVYVVVGKVLTTHR